VVACLLSMILRLTGSAEFKPIGGGEAKASLNRAFRRCQ